MQIKQVVNVVWFVYTYITWLDLLLHIIYCLPCLSKNWYFEVGEACLCEHLCVASLLLYICSPNPWVLFSGVGVCCWMSSSASRAPGVFGGLALPWSDLVVVSSTSCCSTVYVVQGKFELELLFVQWASICFCQGSTYPCCGCSSSIGIWSIKV